MYEPQGGSFKYAIKPTTSDLEFHFNRSEREEFIEKCEYLTKSDMYYDDVKMYYINFDTLEVIQITDKLFKEMKNLYNMTPKEKAAELVDKFMKCHSNKMADYSIVYTPSAIKMAIVCVDEIMLLDCLTDEGWLNVPQEYKVQYWKEVKQELNEL